MYNRETVVARAIDSVLAQSMTHFELIIVDDCSSDRSCDVAETYLADPRVSLHRPDQNLGPGGARNYGAAQAKGRYLAFQDSDDRWFPEKLERQLTALEAKPEANVCFCAAIYFSPEQSYYIPGAALKRSMEGDLAAEMLYGNPTTPQTLLIERALFESCGGFDETLKINEDWDLAIRLATQAHFTFVSEPFAVIYRTAGSVSSNQAADIASRERFLTEYASRFRDAPVAHARQRFVTARMLLDMGAPRRALPHLITSFRSRPSVKTFMAIGLSAVKSLMGADRAG